MLKSRGLVYVVLALGMVFLFSALAFAQGTETVQLSNNSQLNQQILVAGNGMTLYEFTRDTSGTSNCTGNCLQNWPPLTVTQGTTPSAATGVTGNLGTLVRADNGQTQVTINGMPLYFFRNDTAAGQANGQGVGDVWYVVNAAGSMITSTTNVTGTPTTAASPTAEATATTEATPTTEASPTVAPTATTAPAASAASAVTATATSAVTGTRTTTSTTSAPSNLPTTGASGSNVSLVLLLLGAFTLAFGAGLGLNAMRRPR